MQFLRQLVQRLSLVSHISKWGVGIFVMLASLSVGSGQCLDSWAKKTGGTNNDEAVSLVRDAASNIYITGTFEGSATFQSTTLNSSGGKDVFLVKYDTAGNVVWAIRGGGGSNDRAYGLAIDNSDNLYILGYWESGSCTFGSTTLNTAGSADIFIVKVSSSGVFQWATRAGGGGNDYGYNGITVDGSANVYITGTFGYGGSNATFGSTTLTSDGTDMFVAKLNTSGTWQWAVKGGGPQYDDGYSLSMDASGNIYVTGKFQGNSASFGSTTLTGNSTTTDDGYIAKLNNNGTWQWAVKLGGSGNDYSQKIGFVNNNVYVKGIFTGTATFGSSTLTSAGGYDMFVTKLDNNGNWQWAIGGGGTSDDYADGGIDFDASNTCYITAIFQGTATYGSTTLTSNGNADIVFAQISQSGTWSNVSRLGGSGFDRTGAIKVDAGGNIYICGQFANVLSFPFCTDLTSVGAADAFVARIGTKPFVNIQSTPVTVCPGETSTLSVSCGQYSTLTWSTGSTAASINVGAGTYTATTTNSASGCSNTQSITVSTNPAITVNCGSDKEYCVGSGSIALTSTATGGTGTLNYAWTPTTGLSSATVLSPTLTPTVNQQYILAVTDTKGCVSRDTVLVNINPAVTVNAGSDKEICNGQSVELTSTVTGGTPTFTYTWTPTAGLSSASVLSPVASPIITTQYILLATDTKGCFKRDTVNVTVNPVATINASADKEICEGTSTTLNATATGGTGTLTYSWTPTTGLNNATILQPSASPTTNTQYILTVNDTKGCLVKDTVLVAVNPSVNAYAGLDQEICNGQSVTLTSTASGGTAPLNYTWTPATGLSSATVLSPVASPSTSTQYILLVTDVKGCFKRDTVVVTVNPLVSVNASTDKEICAGSSTTLNATATGGTGVLTYNWSPTTGLNNASILQPIATPTTTTQYILTVNDTKNCPVKDTVVVTVNPLPSVNAGADAVLCLGNLATIGNTASGGTGTLTYSWSPLSGIIGASTSPQINVKPNVTTDYIVVVTDSKGCEKRDTLKVTVNPKPDVDAGANTVICAGVGTAIGNPATGSSGYVYDWTPVAGLSSSTVAQPIATPTVTTTYQVIVTDVNGCKDTSSLEVRVRSITTTENTTSLDFGTLDACEGSKTLTLDITNTGTDDILFTKQNCTSTSFVMTDGLPFTLAKGATKTLTIRFAPTSKGAASGTLTLTGDPCNYAINVDVKGEKLQLAFTTDKPSLNYGVSLNCNSVQWDSTIIITNTGTDKMTITSSNFAPTSAFSIVSPLLPQDILSNGTLAVKVRYAPASVGTYSSELQLNFIAGTCSDVIRLALSGTHIIPDAGVTPPNITFPDLLGCDPPRDTLLTISNLNLIDVDVESITPSDAQFKVLTPIPIKVAAGQSKQVKLRFDPSANGAVAATMKVITNPCSREVIVQLKGNKQGVSFSTPDTLDVGTLIACSQTSISKTFTIKNTSGGGLSGQISNVGSSSPFTSTIKTGDAMPNGTDQSYSVTFTPNATTAEGIIYGKIDVSFLPCDVAKTIVLKARKTDVRLTADATIDYGSVQTGTPRSRTISIVNTGTADMTIATLSGISAPFTQGIVNPPLPALLKPNDTLKVEVIFTAQTGKFTATIKADGTIPCIAGTSTTLTVEGTDKPIPSISGFDKNVGNVLILQPKNDVVDVTNDGTVDMNITGAAFDASSNPAFSVVAGQFPIPITVGQKKQINISFVPTVVGTAQGLLIITGDQDTASARVTGVGFDNVKPVPSISATPTITFDSVCTGQSKQLSATLTNNGNADLQLLKAEWVTNTGNVFTTTLPAQPLAIGRSIIQTIDFSPTTVGLTNAQVRWIADLDTAITDMSGIGKVCLTLPDTAQTLIALRDITAQAGEKVNLVLYIAQQKNMQVPGAPKNFTAKIRYNPTMLFNEQTQNVCVNTDVTNCQIDLTGTIGTGNDLAVIPCLATLGISDNSLLTLEDFQWTDGTVKSITQTQNGKITITGICEQGGVRLYIPASNSISLTTRPNPAQNTLQIQYGLREPLNVTLELLDVTGQVVQTILSNQSQVSGGYLLSADLSLLGNGVYQLRLITGVETLTSRVDVVK